MYKVLNNARGGPRGARKKTVYLKGCFIALKMKYVSYCFTIFFYLLSIQLDV